MSVDLLDDAEEHREHEAAPRAAGTPRADHEASRRGRPRVGVVAAAVAVVLAALVLWPDSSPPSVADAPDGAGTATAPPPENPRLLAWPGRGPWAGDADLVAEAAAVWGTNAAALDLDPPGDDVHALWAGPLDERAVVVLQSVSADGGVRVAQLEESRIPGSADGGALRLVAVSAVTLEPDFLTLTFSQPRQRGGVADEPGAFLVQVLPAPDLLEEGVVLQRVDDDSFVDIAVGDDGLSSPWAYTPRLEPAGPVVAAVRIRGPYPGILASGLVTDGQLIPSTPPVQLVSPEWGRMRSDLPEDYLDGVAALAALDRTTGRVAVLGSTPTP